jgi:hypothetical protein
MILNSREFVFFDLFVRQTTKGEQNQRKVVDYWLGVHLPPRKTQAA